MRPVVVGQDLACSRWSHRQSDSSQPPRMRASQTKKIQGQVRGSVQRKGASKWTSQDVGKSFSASSFDLEILITDAA
jgi:hypothetical protein